MSSHTLSSLARRHWGLVIPVLALGIYLYTAYPEPGWIDSGELAAVAHTLGVAHPPGCPLYVLIARCFVALIPGSFFPLTFLSALAVSAGLAFLLYLPPFRRTSADRIAGAAIVLVLALAPSVWKQAIINEVYALQFGLLCLFIYCWWRVDSWRRLPLLAYLAGLSFAVHQTAIFLIPFLLEAIWDQRQKLSAWLSLIGFGLLGATPYAYMPIRSAVGPVLNWGGTHRWDAFWRHVTGWQYANYAGIESWEIFKLSLKDLGGWLWANFPVALLPLAVIGLFGLAMDRKKKRLFRIMLAGFVAAILFGLNFASEDVEAFYLLAFIMTAVWVGYGIVWLTSRYGKTGQATAILAVLSVLIMLPSHFTQLNRRNFRLATNWVRDAAETIPTGGMILTAEWDHYSPWLYLRFVEGWCKDLFLLDTELLRRSWFPDFVLQVAPQRYIRAKVALDVLRPQIDLFETGQPFDTATIEQAYADAIYQLSLGQAGPVFVDWTFQRRYLRGAREVPWGLIPRAFRPDEVIASPPVWPAYRNDTARTFDDQRSRRQLEGYRRARQIWQTYQVPTGQ